MKKSTALLVLSILSALVFVSSAMMTTYAAWNVQNDTINAVSMGSVQVRLEEEYEQGQVLMPGMTADKKVWAKNTGELDIAIRVIVTKAWGAPGRNGSFIEDKKLSTDNILIPFNQKDWYYNQEDNYHYYKGVLAPGETTPPLFEQFVLSAEDSNAYRNKQANITVTVECVQAQGNGISVWGMSFEKLGVSYKAPEPVNTVTRVHFVSPEAGFDFPDNEGDLFAAFKLLAPGENRVQAVEVKNLWSKPVEIYLWAAVTPQVYAGAEKLALVDQLLREYTQITITEGAARIYRGAVWGNPTLDSRAGDSMRYPYSLGIFQPGQGKTLRVDLTLDSRMDNRFQDLLGLVNWIFSAGGDEGGTPTTTSPNPTTTSPTTRDPASPTTQVSGQTEVNPTNPPGSTAPATQPTGTLKPPAIVLPKTGDRSNVTFWASLAVGSGALLVVTLLAARRQKRNEQYT